MSMIERIARAIATEFTGSVYDWEEWVPEARVALEAMLEPTDQMEEAARDYCDRDSSYGTIFSVMVTAALKEGGE